MAVMPRSITVALLCLGLSQAWLFGCAPDRSAWYGEWEGKLDRADRSAPDDGIKQVINTISLTFQPDGTFKMVESGIPKSGTANLGSKKAFLTVQTIMGRQVSAMGSGASAMNRELTVELQEDGTLLFSDPDTPDLRSVRLTRATQPAR